MLARVTFSRGALATFRRGNSHYSSVTPRRGWHPAYIRRKTLVGRVPSPGIPISAIMRTRLGAGPIEPTVQNGCQPQADQDWLRCVAQMDLHPAVRQFLNTFHAVEVHDRLTVNPNELLARQFQQPLLQGFPE